MMISNKENFALSENALSIKYKYQTLFDCKKKEAISLLFSGIFDIQACNTTSPVFIVAGTSITR